MNKLLKRSAIQSHLCAKIKTSLWMVLLICHIGHPSYGQTTPTEMSIAIGQLISQPFYKSAHIGVAVRDISTNELLAGVNDEKLLIPASTLKLITNFAARALLGAQFTYTTRITHDGYFDSLGVLNGNIYIEGSGDPTLGSSRIPGVMTFGELLSKIKTDIIAFGIFSIKGDIIADHSVFDAYPIPPSWQWNDLGNYYAAGAWGINVHENDYALYFYRDGSVGEMTRLDAWEPFIPNLEIENEVTIDSAGTDDNAYIYGGPYTYQKRIVGTIPQGKGRYKVKGSLPDPPLFMAYRLAKILETDGAEPLNYKTLQHRDDNKESRIMIASYTSPTVGTIIRYANDRSINVYSEALLKTVGKVNSGRGSDVDGIAAIRNFISRLGLDDRSIHMEDGCGLSSRNLLTPGLMAAFLRQVATTEDVSVFTSLMPMAGYDGTVRSLLQNSPAKGNVWVKSGSMEKILTYAGYCRGISGRYVSFSIMLNASSGRDTRANRRELEKIIEIIYRYS